MPGLVQGVEGVEHLLLGGLPAGDELNVVHQKDIRLPVFLPKLLIAALSDGGYQLVGKGVPLDVDDLIVWMVGVDGVGDGVE